MFMKWEVWEVPETEWGPKLGEWEDQEKWNKGMNYWWT